MVLRASIEQQHVAFGRRYTVGISRGQHHASLRSERVEPYLDPRGLARKRDGTNRAPHRAHGLQALGVQYSRCAGSHLDAALGQRVTDAAQQAIGDLTGPIEHVEFPTACLQREGIRVAHQFHGSDQRHASAQDIARESHDGHESLGVRRLFLRLSSFTNLDAASWKYPARRVHDDLAELHYFFRLHTRPNGPYGPGLEVSPRLVFDSEPVWDSVGSIGIESVNRVPTPRVLSRVSAPPCLMAAARAITSPCPVPRPTSLVVKNGSKSRAWTASDIPQPLSDTVIVTWPWVQRVCTETTPGSLGFRRSAIAWAALTTRFNSA